MYKMYCNQCGNILTEQGAFCSFCGAKNEDTVNQPAAAEVQTAVTEPAAPVTEQPYIAPQPAAQMYTIPQPPVGYIPEPPVPPTKPVKEEKYYTFGHIMLCLGAAAIMAIAAGVFAGLYFSVI